MDFVKREDNTMDPDSYKIYLDNLQKATDYQHTPISMEQLHQVMQSSLSNSSIMHNFQLPISPRQMSTLMLKTNHLTRTLNFNELPSHLQKNLTMDIDLPNELSPNIRHEDIISQNLARNLDLSLARSLNNEIELQNSLTLQNLHEQELARNLNVDLNRINELSQNIRDIHNELGEEMELAQIHRQNEQAALGDDARKSPFTQYVDTHILEQHLAHRLDPLRLEANDRLDQIGHQRIDNLPQRLDQRLVNGLLHDHRHLEQTDNIFPMPFHIKSEQKDDGYYYDNMSQGLSATLNGEIPLAAEFAQTNPQNLHQDQGVYNVYNNHNPAALNPLEIYSRNQSYLHNYITNASRDDPQNLVVTKQYETSSPYTNEPKKDDDSNGGKKESKNEPKENLKPIENIYAYSNDYVLSEKNENDASLHNKISEDLAMTIKGEYACYKCNEGFPSKRVLKQHGKTCDSGDISDLEKMGKFSCAQCSYRCQSPAILKIHERTHTGEKPYACTFCDYKSGQKNNVAKHILVHMKQKPFRCQYCEYRCAQKNNLVVHERTHTGYKPFACPYCDYRTVQKPNLVKHMYLHTDQKPFSCDMCNYRCVQKTNLTKHKQRHLNEKDAEKIDLNETKPYKPRQKTVKCPHCSYRCVQKASLEKHLQFKHSDIVFSNYSEFEQGLNLMKSGVSETVHNLSVKKDIQCDEQKVLEPLQIQS